MRNKYAIQILESHIEDLEKEKKKILSIERSETVFEIEQKIINLKNAIAFLREYY